MCFILWWYSQRTIVNPKATKIAHTHIHTHKSSGQSRLISTWPIWGHLAAVLAWWWTRPGLIGQIGENQLCTEYFFICYLCNFVYSTVGVWLKQHKSNTEGTSFSKINFVLQGLFKFCLWAERHIKYLSFFHASIAWKFKILTSTFKKGVIISCVHTLNHVSIRTREETHWQTATAAAQNIKSLVCWLHQRCNHFKDAIT